MSPVCTPSRTALLSGACPHRTGNLGLAHRGFPWNDYTRHVIHTLRNVGYHSVLLGIQHIAADRREIGYDEIVPLPTCEDANVSEEAGVLMENQNSLAEVLGPIAGAWLEENSKEPFFASVGFYETHRPFPSPAAEDDPRYCIPPTPIVDTPETRDEWAGFCSSAQALDGGVGKVLESLERSGLADRTLVIFMTDHGVSFPNMKANLTDHGIGVAMIMRGPHQFSGGRIVEGMISQVDVFPTLCELLDIPLPEWVEGRSFLPILRNEVEEINEEIFAELTYHGAYEPQRAVRTQRWKYIRRFDERATPVLANIEDSPTKDLWIGCGYGEARPDREQLYDLVLDPCESRNLVVEEPHAGVLEEMRDRLERWMERTKDPLLAGPVKAPSGAKYNSQDDISPSAPLIEIP